MMGFVIDGVDEVVEGLACLSWRDDRRVPRLSSTGDGRRRSTRWLRGIVLHTTKGIPGGRDRRPQQILPGTGPDGGHDLRVARYWSGDPTRSGAHLVVDHDGSIVCTADLMDECAFHAGPVNDVSIGIEIYQGRDAEMYADQLAAVVRLVDWLTRRFGIQRQMPHRYVGGPLTRLAAGGRNLIGVYGHRDVTSNRGAGDPGDAIFELFIAAGYEPWDLEAVQDLEVWKQRQRELHIQTGAPLDIDGIPGGDTRRALAAAGRPHGQWVPRPGD
jgi:hypothetical protein